MNISRLLAIFLAAWALACQQTSTQDFLNTEIGAIDSSPPAPLVPTNGAATASLNVQLFWTARAGISQYMVEVSRTNDFTAPIAGSPFTASGTTLTVTVPDAVTHWWRVKTLIMKGEAITGRFEAMNDSVYVYCAHSTSCADTGKVGNKSYPFETLRTAISTAKVSGKSVKVASRGGGEVAYAESITLADGISMFGGYDSTFAEDQRSAATNITLVSSGAIPVTAALISRATTFEGFKIQGLLGFALYIDQSDSNLTIRGNTILAGDVTNANTQAVYCNKSSARLIRNIITGGQVTNPASSGQGLGINLQECSGIIDGNTITGGISQGASSTGMLVATESNPIVTNNVISGGNPLGAGNTIGVNLITGSDGVFVNNTIMGGISASGQSHAIIVNGNNLATPVAPVIENNILFTRGGVSNRYCINETGSAGYSNPASVRNNLFLNCPTALYRNVDGGTTLLTTIAAVNDYAQSLCAACTNNVSGNVTISGGQNPFVDISSQNYRLQNNGSPMTAQEWLNIAYGGLDASGTAKGSVTTDRDVVTRTLVGGGALNAGAAGYSMGAYEF